MSFLSNANLEQADNEVFSIIENELKRQTNHLEMIASENFTSPAVMQAMGSVFTNKYAEGYPYKRYYGGCEFADQVEQLAIDRACEIFYFLSLLFIMKINFLFNWFHCWKK